MASMSDIRNGMVIDFKDDLWEVVEFLHVKPGKGPAFMRSKLKNLRNGRLLENTFRESDSFNEVRIERTKKEYLYREGDFFVLMDTENYEQMHVDKATIGDKEKLMQENMEITVATTPSGEIIGIDLPTTVIQTIAECEPNVKGNTASGGGKVAFTETGLRIMVPFFVEAGEKIKIDTRSCEYIERA
ncbi:MAG: elongation factor P [Candidatus Cloacimonetes bacterium]|jgi:elongation factor P|nr:elongation factor P [Candidatus Cloacimonadota bacterium]MCK9336070.1 elongation factor P [Candidatus Cloacimonadota bacterium]MDD3096244.1 elongation factor P [Candidatus Cloacimonadota bacterium]MDD3579270.1 elongation factor P [Candidatus Cloacimonadota bacterium]MDY0337063.1 elongation factor P [Candidatus Cloacimonadaceae bacterium]